MSKKHSCPFACFGLTPAADIDLAVLDERYYTLQQAVHPDRFAASSLAERTAAAAKCAELNVAYARLKHPIERLWALLEAQGVRIDREKNMNTDPDVVEKIFELREEMQKIQTVAVQQTFLNKLETMLKIEQQNFMTLFAEKQFNAAVLHVHWMSYLYKMMMEVAALSPLYANECHVSTIV
jgi:molecular chaperone HscB